MRKFLLLPLLIICIAASGQRSKWQLSFQLQPEITFHKEQYTWWEENPSATTINIGLGANLQYNLNNRFFITGGAGFISRKLKTSNFLNQVALPPPRRGFSMELVTTDETIYRVLSLPVSIGYNFLNGKKTNAYITTGFAGNFLLNAYYESNFFKYQGSYKKNFWQGYSVMAGVGFDHRITGKMFATGAISYSFVNTVRADEYLRSQNENGLALEHKFLTLSLGMKIAL